MTALAHPNASRRVTPNAGWIVKPLGAITTKIGSGATPLGGEAAYKASGISLIRSLNVHDSGFRHKDLAFIDDIQAKSLSNVNVEPHDVLLNITGASVTRCCTVPSCVLPARVNQHVSILRPIKEVIDSQFLHYLLISPRVKARLLRAGEGGSTRQALTKGLLQEFEIEFPTSIEHQRRIVTLLDEAFEAIDAAKVNAMRNLQATSALFEAYRDSVFQSNDANSYVPLKQFAVFRNGVNFTKSSRGKTLQIVGVGDFQDKFFIPTDYLSSVTIDGEVNKDDLLRRGDLLSVRSNGNVELIGRTMVAEDCPPNTLHSGFTIRTRLLRKDVSPKYLCHFMRSSRTRRQMIEGGTGVNIKSLNQGTLGDLAVPLPPSSKQMAITAHIDEFSIETQRLEQTYRQKLQALDDLKESLLHQAFSGNL